MTIEEYIVARGYIGARAAAARKGWEAARRGEPNRPPYVPRGWGRGLYIAYYAAHVTATYVVKR